MLKSRKQTEQTTRKVRQSTIALITESLLKRLNITMPITEEGAEKLCSYFESEEVKVAQKEMGEEKTNDSYLDDVSNAVDDLIDTDDERADIDDLNKRLHF